MSGVYSFVNVPLEIGENTFRAIPIDALGNAGVSSALVQTVRDLRAPEISIFTLSPNQVLATLSPNISARITDDCEVDESAIFLNVQVGGVDVDPPHFDYDSSTGVLSFTMPQLPDLSTFTIPSPSAVAVNEI